MSSSSQVQVDYEKLEEDLTKISLKLAAKGIHKPLVDFRLGRPSSDSVEVSTGSAVAGYYDVDGQEVITQKLTPSLLNWDVKASE